MNTLTLLIDIRDNIYYTCNEQICHYKTQNKYYDRVLKNINICNSNKLNTHKISRISCSGQLFTSLGVNNHLTYHTVSQRAHQLHSDHKL